MGDVVDDTLGSEYRYKQDVGRLDVTGGEILGTEITYVYSGKYDWR